MIIAGHMCSCGNLEIASIQPGCEAEYGIARDANGAEDPRLPPILIAAPVPDTLRCWQCMPKRRKEVTQ
jgi:hypothetical protein